MVSYQTLIAFVTRSAGLPILGKLLFSTDAYALPELYLVGAAQFRYALARLLDGWVRADALSTVDAERVAAAIGGGNAARIYGLTGVLR